MQALGKCQAHRARSVSGNNDYTINSLIKNILVTLSQSPRAFFA